MSPSKSSSLPEPRSPRYASQILRLALDTQSLPASLDGLQAGHLVVAEVLARDAAGATLIYVLGRRLLAQVPPEIPIGATLQLQVLEREAGDLLLGVVHATDAARSGTPFRRFATAAVERLFGPSPAEEPPIVRQAETLSIDELLAVAVRGERPVRRLIDLDPQVVARSSALSQANAESLLAAQAALERLDVPATEQTIAAALPQANAPARLSAVLLNVSRLFDQLSPEGRIVTLRTLAEFLARVDPQSALLESQIASFVDHIVTGGDRKLVTLLQALQVRQESTNDEHAHLLATAHATERATALTHDLKTLLLDALSRQSTPVAATTLLTEALEALTATQMTALHAAKLQPRAWSFLLPIAFGTRHLSAQITVQRDAPPDALRPLDAANFHATLTLETRSLGQIRIELEAIDRVVQLSIEAPNQTATEYLQSRLEHLVTRIRRRAYTVGEATVMQRILPATVEASRRQRRTAPERISQFDTVA